MTSSTTTLSVPAIVERVGTCADGCCPRYHCQACGDYWLGDEVVHPCGTTAADLEQEISSWIAAELDRLVEEQTQASKVEHGDEHRGRRLTPQLADRNASIRTRAHR